jgi:hypothetical protein
VDVRIGQTPEARTVPGVKIDGVKEKREGYVSKDCGDLGYSVKLWLLKVFHYFLPYLYWQMDLGKCVRGVEGQR